MDNQLDPNLAVWQIQEQDFHKSKTLAGKLKFLLRYAILAPSIYNTQPWKFMLEGDKIHFLIDPTRWLKVIDPDQREVHLSLGCALENFLIAAEHFGLGYQVTYLPQPKKSNLIATVEILPDQQPSLPRGQELFYAITKRRTNRSEYETLTVPEGDLRYIRSCRREEEGLDLYLTDDLATKRQVDALLIRSDALQFSNPAYRQELSDRMAQGGVTGAWLISKLGRLAVAYLDADQAQPQPDLYPLASAPGLGVLSTKVDDRVSQIKAGQLFERIFLTATAIGVRVQPLSQVLQVPELRSKLSQLLPTPDLIPQHAFRLGYGRGERDHTPRRDLEAVLL